MNPYCRRAVAQAVQLASEHGGTRHRVHARAAEPPRTCCARRSRGALERGVETRGVLVTDPAFAGSDTLATASALAAAIAHEGPFDLILAGRNSVDADTGQVGPELAELLDLPFATGVRHLALADGVLDLRCEHDDGWVQARLVAPGGRVHRGAAHRSVQGRPAGPRRGPGGAHPHAHGRRRSVPGRGVPSAARRRSARSESTTRRAPGSRSPTCRSPNRSNTRSRSSPSAARSIPNLRSPPMMLRSRHRARRRRASSAWSSSRSREVLTRELLGAAAGLDARVVAITTEEPDAQALGGWGADEIVWLRDPTVEEDVATGLTSWARDHTPVGAPRAGHRVGTRGREPHRRRARRRSHRRRGRARARRRTSSWRGSPRSVAGSSRRSAASSPVQLATVRAGMLPRPAPRAHRPSVTERVVPSRGRVRAARPHRATTTSTCSPRRTPSSASARASTRATIPRSIRSSPRSTPSWARPARSPTRAGSPAPARSASPAARSRPDSSSRSARAGSSTTWSACAARRTVLAINTSPGRARVRRGRRRDRRRLA